MVDLTSSTFVVAVQAALCLVFLWILVRWNAAGARSLVGFLKRIVGLLLLMVLAVLSVLAPVNAQYGWYTSWTDVWSDLTGGTAVVGPQAVHGEPAAAAARTVLGRSPLAALPTTGRDKAPLHLTPTSYGGYHTFDVPGAKTHYTGKVTMWFPPGYRTGVTSHPVVEVFHGFLPSPLGTFSVFRMDEVVKTLHERQGMREPIIVIPHWAPDRLDTECVDGGRPGDPPIETWMTEDVPAWVYQHFRVDASRDSWATSGASAGGWCALMATMLHPRTYSAAISLGGYAYPDFDPPFVPFTKDSAAGRRYDMVGLART